MTGCYIDESGTDNNSPIAVVAGLVLDDPGYLWLDVEWSKILKRYGIEHPIHMREFTPNGVFKALTHNTRRSLFTDLVSAINEHKLMSLGATLTADQYRQHFNDITQFSMYAACFSNLVMLSGQGLEAYGNHRWPLSYFLDDGNTYKAQILEGRPLLLKAFPRIAAIEFLSDSHVNALQAADVVSWAVRRHLSGIIAHGLEPLDYLFDQHHLVLDYKEEWMRDVAAKVQAAEFAHNS
jgi:uncharacterized protein DUF3800